MTINFVIGDKKAMKYIKNIVDAHKVMAVLTEEKVVSFESKNYLYLSNFVYWNFDRFMNKYSQLTLGQKIASMQTYLSFNNPEYVYIYCRYLILDIFKMFLKSCNEPINFLYLDEKDIEPIVNLNDGRISFERISE